MEKTLREDRLLSTQQAAALMGVSRVTFIKLKKQLSLAEVGVGRKLYFDKCEIAYKYLQKLPIAGANIKIFLTSDDAVESLHLGHGIYDLRKISIVDSFGVLALVGHFLRELDKTSVCVLTDDDMTSRYLRNSNIFRELQRLRPGSFFVDGGNASAIFQLNGEEIFLPAKYIGARGQERTVAEDLRPCLNVQGFNEEIIDYIGWAMGELADNSHTHAQGPCHIMVERFGSGKFCCISVGDVGVGIPSSLKTNPTYKQLSDVQAMITAFRARATSWIDTDRGKGLSDVLSIAAGNGGLLRVESAGTSIVMDFRNGERVISKHRSLTQAQGTRIGLVLIDSDFDKLSRAESDQIVETFLRILK